MVNNPPIIVVINRAEEFVKKNTPKKLESLMAELVCVVQEFTLTNVTISATDNMEGVRSAVLSVLQTAWYASFPFLEIPFSWMLYIFS